MLTLKTPYLQVQAIRRRLRDQGIPTLPRPFYGYKAVCNLPATSAGTQAAGVVRTDGDSYFVWLSTYHYSQSIAWEDGVAIGQGESAESSGIHGVRVRIENLSTGRRFHSGDFIDPLPFDWFQGFNSVSSTPQPPQSEVESGDQSTSSIPGWRCYWPEPVLLQPQQDIRFTIQIMNFTVGALADVGQVFWLCGVRLYPRRG